MNNSRLPTIEHLVKIGSQYPVEFVNILASDAARTLRDWLDANGAPQEAIDLLDNAMLLRQYAGSLEAGELTDSEASFLAEIVPETTSLIARMGGVFRGREGGSFARENVVTWIQEGNREINND